MGSQLKKKLPAVPPKEKNPVPAPEPAVEVEQKIPSAPQMGPPWAGPFWPAVATSLFTADEENPASFPNVERIIRGQPIEWGALFDQTGKAKVVLTANSSNSIPILPDLVTMMRKMGGQAIFTHNHPQSSSFSMDDVNLFIGCGMREIRVVSQRYVYSLSDPTYAFHKATLTGNFQHLPGWDLAGINKQFNDEVKSQEFKRVMIESDIDGKARMMAMVMGTPMEYEKHVLMTDMVNRRLFTKWGLTYNVIHIEEPFVANPLKKEEEKVDELPEIPETNARMEANNRRRTVPNGPNTSYELNDHDSSTKFKDFVRKEYDKDPLMKQICEKVDEFNKCECPRDRDVIRKDIEKLDRVRRQRDIEKLR